MIFLTVLIIGLIPNCLLGDVINYNVNNYDVNKLTNPGSRPVRDHPRNVLRFMKKLYRKVNSGRIQLPSDANTVRSVWPIGGKSQNGYLVYNVSSPVNEKIVKAALFMKGHNSRHPARILIDVVPTPGALHEPSSHPETSGNPPGINVPFKDADRLDIKQLLDQSHETDSLVSLKLQQLQNGLWTEFEPRKSPIIVIFSSDVIPARLNSYDSYYQVSKEVFEAKSRLKRESNSIHSSFNLNDFIDDPNSNQLLQKEKLKSVISKRQKYLRKKLNRKKARKHKKKKSSKRRKQKKNGFIPYPKNYPKNSKKDGSKKKKKIIPETFISASRNRISNEVIPVFVDDTMTSSGVCEFHERFVNFKDLGWDFVIAPFGFSPNYCSGGCPNPLSRSVAGSNYAIIRSLMREIGQWHNLSPSYCGPEKMSSLTLLIQTQDGRIELKNYPDMQVEACSCQ